MNEKWFALDISQVEKKLKTNAASGLSRKAARSRCVKEEESIFSVPKKKRGLMLLELLFDFSFLILLTASLFSLFFESEREIGIVLFVLLILNLAISFVVYEYSQSVEEKHRETFQPSARVIRDGKLYHLEYTKVVPGDVIMIEAGDALQADIRLITSHHLKVYMQTVPEQYELLTKYADGVVRGNENDARNMVNMLHAGSVVEEGSARGIVVAVGRYTYFGAMLRGRKAPEDAPIPVCLKRWKKIFSSVGFFSLVAVLPLAVLGLIGNKIANGTGLLSTVFLTVLSLSATFFVAKISTSCKFFFSYPLRPSGMKKQTIAVRSSEVFERISGMDYLFVLDGSVLTDGVLHCEKAYVFNGRTFYDKGGENNKQYLSELVALYVEAEKNKLTLSATSRTDLSGALEAYIEECHVDTDALKIRCFVQSFLHGNIDQDADRLYFTDRGQKKILSVFSAQSVLNELDFFYNNGCIERLMPMDREKLIEFWRHHLQKGKRILGFSVADTENGFSGKQNAFVGCLVLAEGVDPRAVQHMQHLENMGVRVITFRHPNTTILQPNIPILKRDLPEISIDRITKNNLSITHGFGTYGSYYGFSEEDVFELLRYAHKQRAKVAVIGFTEFAPDVVKEADLFISCAAISEDFELRKNEAPGLPSSTSCTQSVKMHADLLIERPVWKGSSGGLQSIAFAIERGGASCRNLRHFFCYVLTSQVMRIIMAVFPILFGYPELDSRHILLFGCVIDWVAFFFLGMQECPASRRARNQIFKTPGRAAVGQYLPWLLTATCCSVFALVLPRILGALSDGYLYRIEHSFFSLLLLHFTLLGCIMFFFQPKIQKNKVYCFFAIVGGCILLFALGLMFAPLGTCFELMALPFSYATISIVPSVLLVLMFKFLPKIRIRGQKRFVW